MINKKHWKNLILLAGLSLALFAGAARVWGQDTQPGGPLTESLPQLDGTPFEKAVVVELTTNQDEVSLVSTKVVYGRARTTIGDPKQWLAQPLDYSNASINRFGVWDPHCREVEIGEGKFKSECVGQADFTIVFPFSTQLNLLQLLGSATPLPPLDVRNLPTKRGKTPIVDKIAFLNEPVVIREELILVDLAPAILLFCNANPSDPDCGDRTDICIPLDSEEDFITPVLVDFETLPDGSALKHLNQLGKQLVKQGVEVETKRGEPARIIDLSLTTLDLKGGTEIPSRE